MIIKGDWNNFLDLQGEELFLVQRKHIFTLISPILLIISFFLMFAVLSFLLFYYIFASMMLFVLSLLLFVSISMSLSVYSFAYWYYNLYILTSKKILEVKYSPLSSHVINDIFLEKVNCTEIDLSTKGFFHELIDMGDLTITFDRPTHQEEFMLQNIKNCDDIGKFLTQKLMDKKREMAGETLWFRSKNTFIPKAAV